MKKHNDQNIKEIIDQIIGGNSKLDQGVTHSQIVQIWAAEFGVMINRYTSRIRFRAGVLRIEISSAALRQELHFGRDQIRKKLNDRLEGDKIKEVIIN